MKLSETENVWPVTVVVVDGVVSPSLALKIRTGEVCLDQQTAAELLPILQHFIATGELPE